MNYEDVIAGLRALDAKDFEDSIPEPLHVLTDALMKLPSPERAIPELFAVLERFPDADFGTPGPLVHTLERMEYADELVASLRRHPTAQAVWMLNRILNTPLAPERRRFYFDLLASVELHPKANQAARDHAEVFIEFQTKKSG